MVITGLTRNQVVGNGSWVRIPPAPPSGSELNHMFVRSYFMKNENISENVMDLGDIDVIHFFLSDRLYCQNVKDFL